MGIKNGIAGIDHSEILQVDWRGPVSDRIYIPTADPTWSISDCANEALYLVNTGRNLAGVEKLAPKDGAQFHFNWSGSVQGFMPTHGEGSVQYQNASLVLSGESGSRFGTPVFTPSKDIAKHFEGAGYALMASPRIYPGQTLYADVDGPANLYAAYYGEADQVEFVRADPGEQSLLIPENAHPIFEIGVELKDGGQAHLNAMGWRGSPSYTIQRRARGSMWRRAWVNGVDDFWSFQEPIRLMQNSGVGLLIQGSREWTDYTATADVTPHLAKSAGLAARVQGMRRFYAVRLARVGVKTTIQLIKMLNEVTVLAEAPFAWALGETYELSISVDDDKIMACAGSPKLEANDSALTCGGIALMIEEGRTATETVEIRPISA